MKGIYWFLAMKNLDTNKLQKPVDLWSSDVTRTRFISHHLWLCHPWGWFRPQVGHLSGLQHGHTSNCSSTTLPSLPNLTGKKRLCKPDGWNPSLQSWVRSEWASSWNHHRFSALTDLGYQGWSPPPRTRGLQGVEFDTIMRTADDAWSRKNENEREVTNVCYYKTTAER